MTSYRLYFYGGSRRFLGRTEFEAEDDQAAMMLARQLCDACSDLCQSFELWDGVRRVDGAAVTAATVPTEDLTPAAEETLIRIEEAMRDSEWAISRSERLGQRIEHLLARKA